MSLVPSRMFFRLLLRAATVRRGRTLTALLALAVAATLATALLTIFTDVGGKLGGDFRKFGANVVMTTGQNAPFTENDVLDLRKLLGPDAIVSPFAYAVATTSAGHPVVAVGTDLLETVRMNPAWSGTGSTLEGGRLLGGLVGSRAATLLGKEPHPDELTFNGKPLRFDGGLTLHTGGDEESRVYFSLGTFTNWTGVQPTVVEMSVPGSSKDVLAAIERLKTSPEFARFRIQPVRQIVEAQANVLNKTRFILLLSIIAITLTVALCVLATLTASVLERRKDYAVMKALGSSQGAVNAIFLGETVSLAVLGAVAGFAAGCGLAMWIGRANFHAAIEPRLSVFPSVLAGCVVVALISAVVPLMLLQKTEPAAMLKGE